MRKGRGKRHDKRGYVLLKEGKFWEAISELEVAIEDDPWSPEAYVYLGMAYENVGQWMRAINVYKRLTRLRPNDAKAHYHLGVAYKNLCQWEKAAESFEKALRLLLK